MIQSPNYGTSKNFKDVEATVVSKISESKEFIDGESRIYKVFKHLLNWFIIIFLTAAVVFLFKTHTNSYQSQSVLSESTSSSGHSKSSSEFTLYRIKYDPLTYFTSDASSTLKYDFLDDYVAIVEPSSTMYLSVEDYEANSANYFEYSVCSSGDDTCYTGYLSNSATSHRSTGVKITCSPFDEFSIEATEKFENGTVVRTLSGSAVCFYVRRELRALSGSDLEALMDAMFTLWTVPEEEGQALYGANYHPAVYFAEAHHFNAAWPDGDHIHEGLGFLPQHIKLSNMFELAIQAVDPSVSLAYWDYTIESSKEETVFDSYAFKEKTFGSLVAPKNHTFGWSYKEDFITDAAIPDGRWANITVDLNTHFDDLLANYGYLRGPWNANPSPYISRFSAFTTKLPTCSSFYDWLVIDSLSDFLIASPYGPHASTHGAIGSVFGCDVLDTLTEQGIILSESLQISLCQKWGFLMKELYRKNNISPRKDCVVGDLSVNEFECGYECDSDRYDTTVSMVKNLLSTKYVGSLSTSQLGVVVDLICDGEGYKLFVGDHVESASPADPSFWPMHPTLERALQAKYMSGGFTGAWPTNSKTEYVCDKANCYEDGTQAYWPACCYGHYESDQLLDFVNADKDAGTGATNKQVLSDTDPTSTDYGMPYIYDSFSWDHCSEDFIHLLTSLKSREHASSLWGKGDRK